MGFFQRLFSADYRKAVAAEAAGDFIEAARLYALCQKRQRVSDMHLAQARREDTLEGRVRSLRNALDFAEDDEGCQTLIRRLLAEALRRQGKRQGPQTDEGHQNLIEAAEHFDASHRHETAGEVFLEAGETARAVDAFSKAGLVARVEALLTQDDLAETRRRRVDNAFKDYEAYMVGGQRDQALASLQICVAEAPEKGEYRRLSSRLNDRILRESHVELEADGRRLRILGRPGIVLGRDGTCDARVRGPSVSRRHTRLLYQN
ncbi:MAG: FHA domain-containing protein, partial [Deltaproteobacteria bacterium]|nr:FHA domain-containing protein [Deltaproteobacteria bacterium]